KLFVILSAISSALAKTEKTKETPYGRRDKGKGGNNADLQAAVEDFDTLFGSEPLTLKENACAMSICRGYYFQYCNNRMEVTESDYQRKKVSNTQLPKGKGASCYIIMSTGTLWAQETYQFGKASGLKVWMEHPQYWLAGQLEIRSCGRDSKEQYESGGVMRLGRTPSGRSYEPPRPLGRPWRLVGPGPDSKYGPRDGEDN
ncbi:hypothetical protein IL306_007335, partial [Fusarium sp. DS 682]